MCKTYFHLVERQGHEYLHAWVGRAKGYSEKGRFQSESDAIAIDSMMKKHLTEELGIKLIEIEGSPSGVRKLAKLLGR
jgi:hypothetical protein